MRRRLSRALPVGTLRFPLTLCGRIGQQPPWLEWWASTRRSAVPGRADNHSALPVNAKTAVSTAFSLCDLGHERIVANCRPTLQRQQPGAACSFDTETCSETATTPGCGSGRRLPCSRCCLSAGLQLAGFKTASSPFMAGVAISIGSAPYLLFGLIGGVYADRLDRRFVMIAGDVVRAATWQSFPFSISFPSRHFSS